MKKPDCYFTITVCESWRLVSCAKKRAEEARGLFGFHLFQSCPDCVKTSEGFRMWGENGHLQGTAADREQLCAFLKNRALRQWRMHDGRIMGYKFRRGSKEFWSR